MRQLLLLFLMSSSIFCKAQYISTDSLARLRGQAEQGDATCQYQLGNLYCNGRKVEQDSTQGIFWYRKAAENGNIEAQIRMAEAYSFGWGVAKDYEQKKYWYTKAAEQGDTLSMERLGNHYRFAYDGQIDRGKALYWYKMAADKGMKQVYTKIGNCYQYGKEGVLRDYAKAIEWYQKAVDNNIISKNEAQREMGYCYYYGGNGIDKDYSKAVYWMIKGSDDNITHSKAMDMIGYCYYNGGYGLSRNYSEAFAYFKKAAEKGYARSQFNIGICYEKGHGITKDLEQARIWYEKAAAQNNEKAKIALKRVLSAIELNNRQQAQQVAENRQEVAQIQGVSDIEAFGLKGQVRKCDSYVEDTFEGLTLSFDNKGNIVSFCESLSEEKTKSIQRDNNGQLVSIDTYNDDDISYERKRTFEFKNKRIIKITTITTGNSGGGLLLGSLASGMENQMVNNKIMTEYFYSQGVITKRVTTDKDNKITVVNYSNYVFDRKGNWISRKHIRGGKTYTEKRTITYY